MNYSSKVDEYNKQVHGIEKKDFRTWWNGWFRSSSSHSAPALVDHGAAIPGMSAEEENEKGKHQNDLINQRLT
jgi:hypothetical protein